MTPEEIQAMAKGLAQGQAIWYVLSACIGGLIAGLGTYVAEKGKNRATREDVQEITRQVKKVEALFNSELSNLNAHHQLRMVAAEKRLDIHQEAFNQWRKLYAVTATANWEGIQKQQAIASYWLFENYLYLDPLARKDFFDGIKAAEQARPTDGYTAASEDVKMAMQVLEKASTSILQGIALPSMTFSEISKLTESSVRPPEQG